VLPWAGGDGAGVRLLITSIFAPAPRGGLSWFRSGISRGVEGGGVAPMVPGEGHSDVIGPSPATRRLSAAIGDGWIFPSPADSSRMMPRHLPMDVPATELMAPGG
jgi:hypothetical protein